MGTTSWRAADRRAVDRRGTSLSYVEVVAPPDTHGQSSSENAAVIQDIADAVVRAQAGERVIVHALGVAVVPASDLDAVALTDDEVEDAMIELDR